MKALKLFLTLIAAAVAITAVPSYAREFIGYTYPYNNLDLRKELGSSPIVVELFSTPACVYCPVADQFIGDLIAKSDIIGLVCPIDYQDVSKGSVALKGCTQRQYNYAATIPAQVATPQMIINGKGVANGYEYQKALASLKGAAQIPVMKLTIKRSDNKQPAGGEYSFDLPAVKMGPLSGFNKEADIMLLEYRKPFEKPIEDGDNNGITTHYTHLVSSIVKLDEWNGEPRTVTFPFKPQESTGGFVVLVQNRGAGMIAAGEYRLPSH